MRVDFSSKNARFRSYYYVDRRDRVHFSPPASAGQTTGGFL